MKPTGYFCLYWRRDTYGDEGRAYIATAPVPERFCTDSETAGTWAAASAITQNWCRYVLMHDDGAAVAEFESWREGERRQTMFEKIGERLFG